MVHNSKHITSPILEAAPPMPVPSLKDGTFHQSLQFTSPDVEETRTLQPISTSNSPYNTQKAGSIPSSSSSQKINGQHGAPSTKPIASVLPNKKRVNTSPKCGASSTQRHKHVPRSPRLCSQDKNHHEARPQTDNIDKV